MQFLLDDQDIASARLFPLENIPNYCTFQYLGLCVHKGGFTTMMRALAYCSLALSLVPLPAMAASKEPQVLASTIKWEINYDKEACHLFNKFGTGKD